MSIADDNRVLQKLHRKMTERREQMFGHFEHVYLLSAVSAWPKPGIAMTRYILEQRKSETEHELVVWLKCSTAGKWARDNRYVCFEDENDAFAFRLRWL